MKKTLLILAFVLGAVLSMNAQTINLEALPKETRDSILISRATHIMKTYFPGHYREDMIPEVVGSTWVFVNPEDEFELMRHNKQFYQVIFPFDASNMKEGDPYLGGYIQFFGNTGEIDCILMRGYDRFIGPEELKLTRSGEPEIFEPAVRTRLRLKGNFTEW